MPKKAKSSSSRQAVVDRDVYLDGTDSASVAINMADKKTNDSTKKNYKNKHKYVAQYFLKNFPTAMDGDKIKIPIDAASLTSFFGYIMASADARSKLRSPCDIREGEPDPWSVSQITGYKSAIVALYTKVGSRIEASLDTELKAMIEGYEKVIMSLKKRGLMKIGEGKKPLAFEGFILLCKLLATAKPERASGWSNRTFMWSYMTLLWNLMTRNESVDDLLEDHFDWTGDAMLIEEQGHKGDQCGEEKYWKHVYANPQHPEICSVLALAVHQFCSEYRPLSGTNHQIFDGTNSKDRFSKNLAQCLSKFMIYIMSLYMSLASVVNFNCNNYFSRPIV